MADTTISPNMGLPVPVPSTTPGPDWASDVVASLNQIDSHNHSTGQGVPVTPDGININADLTMGQTNTLTNTKAVAFTAQSAALSGALTNRIYAAGVDLYYNDGSGNQIRITQSGSVAGSSGTITGLPSGTASASFAGATFTFQSATNTPATMNIGPIITGAASASPKTVTLTASGAMAANYAMTWPTALPGSTSFWNCDTSGNTGFVASTGSGSVVLATSPTLNQPNIGSPTFSGSIFGTISGNIDSNTYSPTVTPGAYGSGQVRVANSFSYMRINNRVTVFGQVSGTTDSSGRFQAFVSMPFAPTSNFSNSVQVQGVVNNFTGTNTPNVMGVLANPGSKNAAVSFFGSAASSSINLIMSFSYDCT